MNFDDYNWDTVIKSKQSPFTFDLKQITEYRDLIFLFVKRDIATTYKQTILGPLWYLFQPVFTTVMFIIVFRHVASLGTDGIPPVLFYFAGTIFWSFFSSLLVSQARVFYNNKDIFGKVYFPRLTVPISVIFGELIKFLIQFALFSIIYIVYMFNGYPDFFSVRLLFLPFIILWTVLMATGLGLMISSVTTKYRDLAKALEFFLSMFMYAVPVVYPLSEVSGRFRIIFILNPVTAVLECIRKVCFGTGEISLYMILYSVGCTLVFLIAGLLLFNKNEKVFVDVI
ncbi:MAG: ABC transporter permease [Lachnospiraceae bacterium]|nr:ABC transporter permease [Lachnospiraceae bacterium]